MFGSLLPPPAIASPSNDNFASAIALAGNFGSVSGSNNNASAEAGEPAHNGSAAAKSIWWYWDFDDRGANCQLAFNANASAIATRIGIYTGASVDALTQMAMGTTTASFNTGRVGMRRYYIAIDSAGNRQGYINLNYFAVNLDIPVNDNFANAIALVGNEGTITGNNTNATAEIGEPPHDGIAATKSVWYSWQIDDEGNNWAIGIDASGSEFTPRIAIYQGNSVDALSLVVEGSSIVSFGTGANGNQNLKIAIDVKSGLAGAIAAIYGFVLTPADGYRFIYFAWGGSDCKALIYGGAGAAQSITGVGFQPDLVWIKRFLEADSHYLFDSVRGIENAISTNLQDPQVNYPDSLVSFDADGFSLGANNIVNQNERSQYIYFGWAGADFKALFFSGNATGQSITGVGFQPDLVWLKDVGAFTSHYLFDSTRGPLNAIHSDTSSAETSYPNGLTDFDTDGFTIGNESAINRNPGLNYIYSAFGGLDFSTVLYTGTGAAQSITGAGFQPDLVWIKNRDRNDTGYIFDSVRGPTYAFSVQLDLAEDAIASSLVSFDADGFSLGIDSRCNTSGENYVVWCWKKGATLDIQEFVAGGTGSTVSHSLGAVPGMIICKNRYQQQFYFVYHSGISAELGTDDPETHLLWLNASDGRQDSVTTWNGTPPTSTEFAIGTGLIRDFYHFVPGDTYLAYLFAPVGGAAAFGYYQANVSPLPSVNLGFQPELLILRGLNGNFNWSFLDSARNTSNPRVLALFSNLGAPEQTDNYDTNFTATGFELLSALQRDTNQVTPNIMAWCFKKGDAFDIVQFVAGPPGSIVAHTLGSIPALIICFNLAGGQNWYIYHSALGPQYTLYFTADTVQPGNWNNSAPTNTEFTTGEGFTEGDSYIAYIFGAIALKSAGGYYFGDTVTLPSLNLGFKPSLFWVKNINKYGYNWIGWDDGREPGDARVAAIFPNSNGRQDNGSAFDLAFTNTGVDILSTTQPWVNEPSNTGYLVWCFKKGDAFDIVQFVAGSSGSTVAHTLGSEPSTILCKNLSSVQDWIVYHDGTFDPANDSLRFSDTPYQQIDAWNGTTPTDTIFTTGTAFTEGNTYIAYIFGAIAGKSNFGYYLGDYDPYPTINTGFEPTIFWVKRLEGDMAGFVAWDNARDPANDRVSALFVESALNQINNENYDIEFTATGVNLLRGNELLPATRPDVNLVHTGIAVFRPANTDFVNRIHISGASGTISSTNVGADPEVGEPAHNGSPAAHSIWYEWTFDDGGNHRRVIFDTLGSAIATRIAVYTGTTLNSLAFVISGTTSVEFATSTTQVFMIAIDSNEPNTGPTRLNWFVSDRPSNDRFADRILLTGLSGIVSTNNVNATAEPGEQIILGSTPSIWYELSFVDGNSPKFVEIDTLNSAIDTVLTVYEGSDLSGLILVAASDDAVNSSQSRVYFATPGQGESLIYHIRVAGFNAAEGAIMLNYAIA